MKYCIWLLPLTFVIASCGNHQESIANTEIQKNTIDSTAYYDSLFAERKMQIDTFFAAKQKRGEFNGNVLFAENGHLIHKGTYGFSTPDSTSEPLRMEHRFQLASVSKPFTATAVLLLYDRGQLKLEDTLGKFFPGFPFQGITVKMLLCHRGGLGNYNYFTDEFWPDKHQPIPNDSVLAILMREKPKTYYKPDEQFDYSNTGYFLLGSIVEKVSGKPFSQFMHDEIFQPLGMKNTCIYDPCRGKKVENGLQGYDWKGRLIEDHYQNGVVGDKGMFSTVEDLFLFDQAIYAGKILKPETWKMAFSGQNPEREEDGKDNYGFGWRIKTSFAGYQVIYHTGWWKGFRSYFIRNTTNKQTILITDNIKRNRFLSIEELLDLADGGSFGSAALSDSLQVEGGKGK
jgi:CubicO group peptidase (beta-lactamase class C family)